MNPGTCKSPIGTSQNITQALTLSWNNKHGQVYPENSKYSISFLKHDLIKKMRKFNGPQYTAF